MMVAPDELIFLISRLEYSNVHRYIFGQVVTARILFADKRRDADPLLPIIQMIDLFEMKLDRSFA